MMTLAYFNEAFDEFIIFVILLMLLQYHLPNIYHAMLMATVRVCSLLPSLLKLVVYPNLI